MSACVSCKASLGPDARFCGSCGASQPTGGGAAPLPETMVCSGCGASAGTGVRFCGNCGSACVPRGSARPGTSAPAAPPRPAPAVPAAPPRPAPAAPAAPPRPAPASAGSGPGDAPPVVYVVPPGRTQLADIVAEACGDHAHVIVRTDDVARVQETLAGMRALGQVPVAVCLVGPSDLLPHVAFEDDTGKDAEVLTDNDWGRCSAIDDAARDEDGLPDVPVTRIPTVDPVLVRRLLSVRDALAPSWDGGVAVSARVWQRASAGVLEQVAPRGRVALQTSPQLDDASLQRSLGKKVGRLYFNVHGSDQVTYWVGDGGAGEYPPVLHPRSLVVAPDAILVSEACYGARHDEGDTMSLRFFAAGGSAFVGSTIIAWGPAAPPNSLADLVPAHVYRELDRGLSLGEALQAARDAILEEARDEGRITPQVVNTVSSFVAYGSPLARVAGAPRVPAAARQRVSSRGTEGARAHGGVASLGAGANEVGDILGRVRAGSAAGPLADARARNERSDRRLRWRSVVNEPLSAAAFAARFQTAAQIQGELAALLGVQFSAGSAALRVAKYESAGGTESIVYASVEAGAVRQTAAVALDATGRVVGRYVTRGGRSGEGRS